MERARYFAEMLKCDVGVFYKRRDLSKVVDGKNPIVEHAYMGADVKDKDIIIMSAAVSDYSPKDVNCEKIKSSYDSLTLSLEKNKDILKSASTLKDENAVIGGFSMETENMEENSVKKMKEKNIDFIVANNLKQKGAGFSVDTNIVTIFDKNGNREEYPIMSKFDVANNVIDKALSFTENYQN